MARRELAWGLALGGGIGVVSLARDAGWAALGPPLLLFAGWLLGGATRWIVALLSACWLLPPLPLPGGDSGPHPAIPVAALGLLAGLARLPRWRIRVDFLAGAVVTFFGTLVVSVPLAAFYSGSAAAAESLARVGLAGISVYLFFYLSHGPGRQFSLDRLVTLLFWVGTLSAAFACADFYFQWPAPARFAEQYVWLPLGVFRRAQGVFYEASTLASLCVFLLVLIASLGVLRAGDRLGLGTKSLSAAAAILLAALVLSFSRAAAVTLAVSLVALGWLERGRLRTAAKLALPAGLAGGGLLLYALLPGFAAAWLERLWRSGEYLLAEPNLILSRRLEGWQYLLGYIQDHPGRTLLGIGYKTLPYSSAAGRPTVADNMYLSLLIETGWLGLTALVTLNAAILAAAYRRAKSTDGLQRLFGVWMFSFWCGQVVQMATGDTLTYWRLMPAYFAVLAVGTRHENRVRDMRVR